MALVFLTFKKYVLGQRGVALSHLNTLKHINQLFTSQL